MKDGGRKTPGCWCLLRCCHGCRVVKAGRNRGRLDNQVAFRAQSASMSEVFGSLVRPVLGHGFKTTPRLFALMRLNSVRILPS